jgi:hypothetical protein
MHGTVSLLWSLQWFVIGLAINILLLRSLNAFGCGSPSLCLCSAFVMKISINESTTETPRNSRSHRDYLDSKTMHRITSAK